jgi:hypothetical protein
VLDEQLVEAIDGRSDAQIAFGGGGLFEERLREGLAPSRSGAGLGCQLRRQDADATTPAAPIRQADRAWSPQSLNHNLAIVGYRTNDEVSAGRDREHVDQFPACR